MNIVPLGVAPPASVTEPEWAVLVADPADQARASEIWRATVDEMRQAGTLADVNAQQIRRYVIAVVMYDRAAAMIDLEGPVITAPKTGSACWNPWWSVMKDADTMASNHEDKLGLNPRRRGAVTKTTKKKTVTTAADSFLGAAKRGG